MRREVLQRAVERVLNDLMQTGLASMFGRAVEAYQQSGSGDREKTIWIELPVLASYLNVTSTYNDAEKHVASILGISPLTQAEFWQDQLSKVDASFIFTNNMKIIQATSFLPRMMSLLDRNYERIVGNESDGRVGEGLSIQTVIMVDEGESLSKPSRIIELVSAINAIYSILAEIEGLSGSSLAVVGMDSGSEKSFDFLGIAKVMHELRETLQWAYNIVVFHRQNATIKNLQVASDTLSIIGKVAKLEASKAISGEDAARMKHGLFAGLEKFAATGSYIREMAHEDNSPALVMRPQPQLLTGPADEIVRDANDAGALKDQTGINAPDKAFEQPVSSNPSTSSYSDEQIAAAIAILEQADKSSKSSEPVKPQRVRKPRKKPAASAS